RCRSCNLVFKPLPGDCCVFCSYGSRKCNGLPKID
ncbi:MAG: GDCCVxC domain-containing (seleno)protein, partial [bacterium]